MRGEREGGMGEEHNGFVSGGTIDQLVALGVMKPS